MSAPTRRFRAASAGRASLGLLTLVAFSSCRPGSDPTHQPVRTTLDEVFATDIVLQLKEDPSDSIAVPGAYVERQNDGFLISDALMPRVRSYDRRGRLRGAFGRYGDGPFEFRRILGIVETTSGRIAVIGSGQAGLTYLTADLSPDTLVKLPGLPRGIEPLGPDLLVHMRLTADRATDVSRLQRRPLLLHRVSEQGVTWSAFRYPFVPVERPYWASMAATVHSSLDIYDRHTGTKLYVDIPLPESSRVMTGGRRHLYLLLNKDFPPWRIAKLRFREDMEPHPHLSAGTASAR